MATRVELIEGNTEEERESILRPLLEFNKRFANPDFKALGLVLKNESNEIVGGLWARSGYDWLYIELLFIPGELREHGLATSLISLAELVGLERRCRGVWLQTFSPDALALYQRLGYVPFGEMNDYPTGNTYYFLKKELTSKQLKSAGSPPLII